MPSDKRPQAPRPQRRLPLLLALAASLALNLVLIWLRLHQPATTGSAGPATGRPPPELQPYAALGSNMSENSHIPDLHWNEAQFQAFVNGVRASYEGRGIPLDDDARQLRDQISARVQKLLDAEQPDPVEDYFKALRERENVQRTPSALHYRITAEGTGEPPKPTDTVVVSYTARTPDGVPLEALSRARVQAVVTDLLPGLAEGVQLLKPGGKALVYLPPQLSFGTGDWPDKVPRGMPLAFFLELHEVVGR